MALDHVRTDPRQRGLPGPDHDPLIDERLAEAPDPKAAMATLVARQPMGRLGTGEEMAAAYLFLAPTSRLHHRDDLVVDGGFIC